MNASDEQIDHRLERKLQAFQPVPPRDLQSMARGRANFLGQAESLAQTVSEAQNMRHIRWIDPISQLFRRKERSPMFASLVSFIVVITMLAGGATVYAAQDSLPGQPLYAMKMTSENFRLEVAPDTQTEMNLNLTFANRRVNEMKALAAEGWLPPQTVESRWQTQLDRALELAAGMQDAVLQTALKRIRQNLQEQAQQMQQAKASLQDRPQAQAALVRVRERIRERLNWVEAGIKDPQLFRERFHQSGSGASTPPSGSRPGDGGHSVTRTPLPGSGFGPGPNATCTQTPGSSYRPGPGAGQTPDDGKSYGPGPDIMSTTTPAGAYGPGPGPDSSQAQDRDSSNGPGPGPNATQPPDSDSSPPETSSAGQDGGNGPGPQPGSTCTPQAGAGPNPNTGQEGSGGDAHHAPEPGSCAGCGDHGARP